MSPHEMLRRSFTPSPHRAADVGMALSLLIAAALTGCSGAAAVRSGASIAEAGKAYTAATASLVDVAVDRHIDWVARSLADSRDRAPGVPQDMEQAVRGSMQTTGRLVEQMMLYKAHCAQLGAYFDALDTMVKADNKDAYVTAVKGLAENVDTLGATLLEKGVASDVHLSSDQASALGALGGIASTQAHGQVVARVLRRDAALIYRQLGIQLSALEFLHRQIKFMDQTERDRVARGKVIAPYLADAGKLPKTPLPDAWSADFAESVRQGPVVAHVADAQDHARRLQQAWTEFVSGRREASDIVAEMKVFRDTTEQIRVVHERRPTN